MTYLLYIVVSPARKKHAKPERLINVIENMGWDVIKVWGGDERVWGGGTST